MKKVKILLLFFIILIITGCNKYIENQSIENDGTKVIIIGHYTKPKSINNENTIIVDRHGREYLEFIVEGVISDFELVGLEWDDAENALKEKDVLTELGKLENKTVIIKTFLPEGIPFEKIKWKSTAGNSYDYIIAEYSLVGECENYLELNIE
ncbi:hypothetical protein [Natronincola ferrireducens]|uniref:Uncharacterized protein n=1 Tax=Natronincola ferrireducens TaxID=393762 RepID=A0A1G8ZQG0_9FIRM|nr:hypothetical protein [Natronincola ferrireducens]SDK17339.1 hypothetical protein SAMN05660472_00935 [Natronincola ferrireducens]